MALEVDLVDHNAEPVEFCKVLELQDVLSAFEQNFLVLAGEIVIHLMNSGYEVGSGLR